jgi:hypothetical protein
MLNTRLRIPPPATTTLVMTIVFVGALTLSAQQPPAPAAPAKPAPADQIATQNQPPRAPAQAANVRVELKITDQHADAPASPKTLTLLIEDRQNGRIRTGRGGPVFLNVDARPEIVRDGRIRVVVSLEYTPGDSDRPSQASISEMVTALVEDGKPLVVSESADPTSDRKVRLELKATVVK